jgi:Flp pilus assembly pilin Flp
MRHDRFLLSERGGAALEYILVSTFAAIVTLAALAFIGKVVQQQLQTMADKLGVDADVGDLGFGSDG